MFEGKDLEAKKVDLLETGSNLTLKDRKPCIDHTELYSAIINGLLTAKSENPAFEPSNSEADKDKTDTFVSVCPALLRGLDSNQGHPR